MRLQPYHRSVLPKLVSLLNEAEAESYEFVPYRDESLQAELKEANSVLMASDELNRINGLAYLHEEWFGETVTLHLRSGPEQWEIGDLLLSALEPRSKTSSLSTSVDPSDRERLVFFHQKGYRPESSLYQMIADLGRRRRRPHLPEGCVIRNLRPDEEEELIALTNRAYDGVRLRPGILARWHAEDPDFGTDWVQVAECEGQLVATVVARSDGRYNDYFQPRRGYLGPAATLPSYRSKGLSQALTAQAMNFLRDRGMRTVCLHTWGGNQPALKLTQKLGFRVQHEWRILSRRVRGRQARNRTRCARCQRD